MQHHLFAFLAILLWAGCDTLDTTETVPSEVVVETYLIAGDPIPRIRLSRTASTDVVYDFTELAVENANVQVSLMQADGTVETTYEYSEGFRLPGVYLPLNPNVEVQPLRTYSLEVILPTRIQRITAQTTIPDTFNVVQTNLDTLIFGSSEQLELNVTRSFFPGRQNIFLFLTEALEPTLDNLTPFLADIIEETDESELADLATGSSPLLNEGNYDINPNDTITIKLPWLAVAFFGPNRLTAHAVDDNVFDFVRSHFVQQGGSTLSPGEIPNVLDHIEGGTGIFGSYARVIQETYIKRPE